jgi:hypothetical protein
LLKTLKDKLWNVYHACDASKFMERLSNLQAWAVSQALPEPILTKILNLSAKASQFTTAYSFPTAHRTSNMQRRFDELSRPYPCFYEIFSWFSRFG